MYPNETGKQYKKTEKSKTCLKCQNSVNLNKI